MNEPMEIYIVVFNTMDKMFPDTIRLNSLVYPFRTLEEAKSFVGRAFKTKHYILFEEIKDFVRPSEVDLEEKEAVIIGNDFRISWKINKATL